MANPSVPPVVVALLLLRSVHLVTGQPLVDNVEQMAQTLYSSIRAVAFPDSPQLLEDKTNIDTRFVLLSPGKILNYQDYYPGEEYTKFLQVHEITKILFGYNYYYYAFFFRILAATKGLLLCLHM